MADTFDTSDEQPSAEPLLSKRNLRGAGRSLRWKAVGSIAERITGLVALAVFARLLTKSDFGLAHLAIAALGLLGMLRDVGVSQAIIQRQEPSPTFVDTCFWVRFGVGVALYLAIAFFAWPIALFYGEDELLPLLLFLGTTYILDALPTVQESILIRDLRIKETSLARIASLLVGIVVATILAIWGFGAWALAANSVAATIASAVFLGLSCPWYPRFAFAPDEFKHLVQFGGRLTGTQILAWFTENFSIAVLGKVTTGTEQVGVFRQSYVIGKWPDSLIGSILGGGLVVSFFRRVQSSERRRRDALVQTTSLLYLVGLPFAMAIIVFAHDVVMVVYGPKWIDIVPLCRILAIGGTFLLMRQTLRHWLVASGHPRALFRTQAMVASAAILFVMIGIKFGTLGITVATTAACILESILLWYSCQKLTAIGPWDWLTNSWHSLVVAILVGSAMYCFSLFALHWPSPALHLFTGMFVGLMVWIPVTAILAPREFRLVFTLTLNSLPRFGRGTASE